MALARHLRLDHTADGNGLDLSDLGAAAPKPAARVTTAPTKVGKNGLDRTSAALLGLVVLAVLLPLFLLLT